jgi:hypothetical protein
MPRLSLGSAFERLRVEGKEFESRRAAAMQAIPSNTGRKKP